MNIAVGRMVAVAFVLLMVTSIVSTPAMAGGLEPAGSSGGLAIDGHLADAEGGDADQDETRDRPAAQAPTNVSASDLDGDTTVERITRARTTLQSLEVESSTAKSAVNGSLEAINASLAAYRSDYVADSEAALEHLVEAQEGIERVVAATDSGHDEDLNQSSEQLREAARFTARVGVADAHLAYESNVDAFASAGERRAVEAALESATGALSDGDWAVTDRDRRDRADLEATVAARGVATVQYRNAWRHGDRAVDLVEANTEAELELSTGQAFERNDTVLVSVGATLEDVRPYRFENATVVDAQGERLDPIELRSRPTSAGNATGSTFVDVGPDLANRTLTVSTTATHDPNRTASATKRIAVDEDDVIPAPPDPDEVADVELSEPETGVTVEATGEGLWERSITVTNETPRTATDARVSPVVRIQNRSAIYNATVTLPLSDDVDPGANLSVLKWDPQDNESWTFLNATVDAANGTISADLESFSYVTGIDEDDWEEYVTATTELGPEHVRGWYDGTADSDSRYSPGERVWSRELPGSPHGSASVDGDRVFTASGQGTVHALDASTGEELWRFEGAASPVLSDVAVANGTVYALSDSLYALDADTGAVLWEFEGAQPWMEGSPTVTDERVFVLGGEGYDGDTLHALDVDTGELLWSFEDAFNGLQIPPVVADDTVYLDRQSNGSLVALDVETGDQRWSVDLELSPRAAPTVAGGTVFVSASLPGQDEPSVHAIDAESGTIEWSNPIQNYYWGDPTVADGTVYASWTDGDGGAAAIDAERGETEWVYDGGGMFGVPVTVAGGTVFVATEHEEVHALDAATGTLKWNESLEVNGLTSLTVASGVLYVANLTHLHAIGTGSSASSTDSRVELGTFTHVRNQGESAVPPGAVPVHGSDRHVVLKDSSLDGIPDAVADANPPIPHATFLSILSPDTIDIDPALADTDGDGLDDADEVDVEYAVYEDDDGAYLEARVRDALADPAAFDTDGDGLSDSEEVDDWETNPWLWDTSRDGMNDLVDPRPHETNTLPELRYRPWSPDGSEGGMKDLLHVTASPTGEAEEVWVHVRASFDGETWSALSTQQLEEHEDGTVDVAFFLPSRGILTTEWPERLQVIATDDEGNRIVLEDYPAGDPPLDKGNGRVAGYVAAGGQFVAIPGPKELFASSGASTSVSVAPIAVGGAALLAIAAAGYSYAYSEPLDSELVGETESVMVHEPVPQTGYEDLHLPDDLEITLPSGATIAGEQLELPAGDTFGEDLPKSDRSHGWDQIKELPGIHNPEDVGSVIEDGRIFPGPGEYDLIIGDNPNAPGQIAVLLQDGFAVLADTAVRNPTTGEWIRIPEGTIHKIANERNDWDHNQVGADKSEVLQNLRQILRAPDEIYEDPHQDRWMYVKRMVLNGEERIVVLFVQAGEVTTAFVPTHKGYSGEMGYSDEHARWYIKSQEMIKRYVPGDTITPDVDEGEQSDRSGDRPDPTQ